MMLEINAKRKFQFHLKRSDLLENPVLFCINLNCLKNYSLRETRTNYLFELFFKDANFYVVAIMEITRSSPRVIYSLRGNSSRFSPLYKVISVTPYCSRFI